MICRRVCWEILRNHTNKSFKSKHHISFINRPLHLSSILLQNKNQDKEDEEDAKNKKLVIRRSFEEIDNKTKQTYIEMINMFSERDIHRRGHVEFIYSALKNMENFGVQKDLEVYKALLDVLPKGKLIARNTLQSEFMHYPKQQQCAIDLLEQMEDNGVLPDYEMEDMLLLIFGRRGYPLRKFWRMMYWMPKFKNLSPWPVPNPPPDDALELAKLAIERICSVDIQAKQTIYQTSEIENSIDDTWIVSSQSPTQKELLASHDLTKPIYVEGSFRVWLRTKPVNYFILRANAEVTVNNVPEDLDDVSHIHVPLFNMFEPKKTSIVKVPSVHEQEDGIIYSACATGSSSQDSLLSWIRHLEKENPVLINSQIVFTLSSVGKEISTVENQDPETKKLENT